MPLLDALVKKGQCYSNCSLKPKMKPSKLINKKLSPSVLNKFRYRTPFMIVDLQNVESKYRNLVKLLPDARIFFSMKCNSNEKVLQALHAAGSGFEIASVGELKILQKIGVLPDKIIYSNPIKPPDHVKAAYKAGIRHFAFDAPGEARVLAKNAPGSRVHLRLKVSDHGSSFPLSSKFGAPVDSAVPLMGFAQDLGLEPAGLTFHTGSQSEVVTTWEVAFEACGKVFRNLARAGITPKILNIGGGFPAKYADRIPTIDSIVAVIKRAQKRNIPSGVELWAEPGRYIVAESAVIAASVIGREMRGGSEWLFLDMGVFQGLMETLEMPEWRYPLYTSVQSSAGILNKTFTLTGPTCDAYDTITRNALLPSNIGSGDRVYFGSTGAYTVAYGSTFNGFKPPPIYYLQPQAHII